MIIYLYTVSLSLLECWSAVWRAEFDRAPPRGAGRGGRRLPPYGMLLARLLPYLLSPRAVSKTHLLLTWGRTGRSDGSPAGLTPGSAHCTGKPRGSGRGTQGGLNCPTHALPRCLPTPTEEADGNGYGVIAGRGGGLEAAAQSKPVSLVPLLLTGVRLHPPGRTDKNLCRCFGAPARRVFPDHLNHLPRAVSKE
jgi:hypothetical protein